MTLTVADILRARLGVETYERINGESSSVGVTAITIFKQNPNRVALLLVNLSANTMYATPSGTPSASNGIRIGPSGGTLISWWGEDGMLPTREWGLLADAASSNLYAVEMLIQPAAEAA